MTGDLVFANTRCALFDLLASTCAVCTPEPMPPQSPSPHLTIRKKEKSCPHLHNTGLQQITDKQMSSFFEMVCFKNKFEIGFYLMFFLSFMLGHNIR